MNRGGEEIKPVMATTASLFAPTGLSLRGRVFDRRIGKGRRARSIMAQQQQQQLEQEQEKQQQQQENQATLTEQQRQQQQLKGEPQLQSLPRQPMAKPKNMSREYGGQWLSSVTRHVRIYAAYIDPITHAFDQTQMDKLTLILDPSNEFVWTNETCQKVYAYFQELVDHYEVIKILHTLHIRNLCRNHPLMNDMACMTPHLWQKLLQADSFMNTLIT